MQARPAQTWELPKIRGPDVDPKEYLIIWTPTERTPHFIETATSQKRTPKDGEEEEEAPGDEDCAPEFGPVGINGVHPYVSLSQRESFKLSWVPYLVLILAKFDVFFGVSLFGPYKKLDAFLSWAWRTELLQCSKPWEPTRRSLGTRNPGKA